MKPWMPWALLGYTVVGVYTAHRAIIASNATPMTPVWPGLGEHVKPEDVFLQTVFLWPAALAWKPKP